MYQAVNPRKFEASYTDDIMKEGSRRVRNVKQRQSISSPLVFRYREDGRSGLEVTARGREAFLDGERLADVRRDVDLTTAADLDEQIGDARIGVREALVLDLQREESHVTGPGSGTD